MHTPLKIYYLSGKHNLIVVFCYLNYNANFKIKLPI